MTDFTITIDANFAAGNRMDPDHWNNAVADVEDLLRALVGRDGMGIDNWSGDQALRGLNFRKGGVVEVFPFRNQSPFVVCPETAGLSSGSGISPSPIPGGFGRFYLRANATFVWVHLEAQIVDLVGGNNIDLESSWDLGSRTKRGEVSRKLALGGDPESSLWTSWLQTSGTSAGWHTVEHWAADTGTSKAAAFNSVECTVLAVYA